MIVLQRLIGISKVFQSFVNHDRNINKHWIDDLHFNFLCCVFDFFRVHTLDLESGAFWLNLWDAVKRLSKIEQITLVYLLHLNCLIISMHAFCILSSCELGDK